MNITFLGTGTSQGVPIIGCDCAVCQSSDTRDNRLRVSIWIEIEGRSIVIDIGPDFRQQMLRSKTSHIDAILISHEHHDHIGGLDDIRPFNFKTEQDMPIYALERTLLELKKVYSYIFETNYPGVPMVDLQVIDKNTPFLVKGIPIIPIEYWHGGLPIIGFRIGNTAYLTDFKTIKAEELQKLHNLDTLIISALHHNEHHSHSSISESLEMVKIIQPRIAYFTHLSHSAGKHAELEETLPPNVRIAYDGLKIEAV